jgi:hypothetical protein
MSCPHPARLQAYTVGALPDEQMDELREHLAACRGCRALEEGFASAEAASADGAEVEALWRRLEPEVEAARERERRAQSRRRLWWTAVPAGALALAMLAVVLPRRQSGVPAPAPPAVSAPDVTLLARLDPAPVELPLEELLVTRGVGRAGLSPEMTAAFQAYQRGDYAAAARRFGEVAQKGGRRFEAPFYFGVSLLLSDRAGEALAPLRVARTLGDAGQAARAQWYLAQAHLKRNNAAGARAELDPLCRGGGERAADACKLIERLPLSTR